MKNDLFGVIKLDYIEMYVPMAKPLVYWHRKALGFSVDAYAGPETGRPGIASYLVTSGRIQLLLSSTYSVSTDNRENDIASFVDNYSCGVKRIALQVADVNASFMHGISNGAIPVKFPFRTTDEFGHIEEAAIKLFDHCEILFIDRTQYHGVFKPGYQPCPAEPEPANQHFTSIDHIASELRINETGYWTGYLSKALGTELIQKIDKGVGNETGMILNISQLIEGEVTWVMTEPEKHHPSSRVQQSLEKFGSGFHHIAFHTENITAAIKSLKHHGVEFVNFPSSYYDMLRKNEDFKDTDIDALEMHGILIDKEDDTFLLQKFIKPISDRPYFFYEIVQRVNGYSGFAVKNIAALRKAEEVQITQVVIE